MLKKKNNIFINVILKHDKKFFWITLFILVAMIPTLFSIKKDFTFKAFYNQNDPLLKIYQDYEKTFGNDDRLVVIASFKTSALEKENLQKIKKISNVLENTPSIVNVESILNHKKIYSTRDDIFIEDYFDKELNISNTDKKDLQDNKEIKGYLVSKDFKTIAIYGSLAPFLDTTPDYNTPVRELRRKLKELKLTNITTHITGTASIMEAFSTETIRDVKRIFSLLLITLFIICFIIFRNLRTSFMILFISLCTVVFTVELSSLFGIVLTATTAMIPQIILAICILDAIHILTIFRFELEIQNLNSAIRTSLEKNCFPTLMTSITTVIGFLSLLWTDFVPIRNLGFISAIGTMIAWINTYFLFPYLLKKVGHKFLDCNGRIFNFCFKTFTEKLYKNATLIIILASVIFIPATYYAAQNSINSDTLEMFQEGTAVRKSYDFATEHIGGIKGIELILKSSDGNILKLDTINKLKTLDVELLKLDYVTKVLSIREYLIKILKIFDINENQITDAYIKDAKSFLELQSSSERGIYKWINLTQTQMRISVLWTLSSSGDSLVGIKEIKKIAKRIGLDLHVTGKTPMVVGATNYMVKTFFRSILLAIVILSLLMSIVFKSVTLGLLSMIPNIVPISLTGALAYFIGIDINMGTVLVASVCLGIAIDDTIHFLTHYQRRSQMNINESIQDKMLSIFKETGHSLINTTVILVLCFSMFGFGNIRINAEFGVLTAIVLIIALASDLILLPAILFVLDSYKRKS